MASKLDQLFGIEGSERQPELKALDKMFGIEGARDGEKPAREIERGETVTGEIVAGQVDHNGQPHYLLENENGEQFLLPENAAGQDLEAGDEVTAERSDNDEYQVEQENSYGQGM